MKIKIGNQEIEAEKKNPYLSLGLMFRRKSGAIVFQFGKPTRQAIHSLFCKRFRAVWLLKRRIVDDRIVEPWKISVRSRQLYDCLVEIPL